MTTFTLDDNQARYQIRGFNPGIIYINKKKYTSSVIITPNQLITDWPPQSIKALDAAALALIGPLKPDVLLIGTGPQIFHIAPAIYGELINQGIGVEIMDTRAACRTYNALCSENRNVAAALILS